MNPTELQSRLEPVLRAVVGVGQWSAFRDSLRLSFDASLLMKTMTELRNAGFDMLIDLTAVDLLEYEGATDRYRVVYQLLDTESGARLEARTHVNDPEPPLATVTTLWSSADWMEREVYDMFGIVFFGHPNPKPLLLPEEFASYPLRKDYPVKGRGERHNFPVITRSES